MGDVSVKRMRVRKGCLLSFFGSFGFFFLRKDGWKSPERLRLKKDFFRQKF